MSVQMQHALLGQQHIFPARPRAVPPPVLSSRRARGRRGRAAAGTHAKRRGAFALLAWVRSARELGSGRGRPVWASVPGRSRRRVIKGAAAGAGSPSRMRRWVGGRGIDSGALVPSDWLCLAAGAVVVVLVPSRGGDASADDAGFGATIPRLKENGPPASGLRFTRSDHEQLFRPTDLTRPATGVSSISASASRRHLHEP